MNTDTAPRPTAVELIAAEQLLVSHDATASPQDDLGEVCTTTSLVAAAAAYMYTSPTLWPFDAETFQPVGERSVISQKRVPSSQLLWTCT